MPRVFYPRRPPPSPRAARAPAKKPPPVSGGKAGPLPRASVSARPFLFASRPRWVESVSGPVSRLLFASPSAPPPGPAQRNRAGSAIPGRAPRHPTLHLHCTKILHTHPHIILYYIIRGGGPGQGSTPGPLFYSVILYYIILYYTIIIHLIIEISQHFPG